MLKNSRQLSWSSQSLSRLRRLRRVGMSSSALVGMDGLSAAITGSPSAGTSFKVILPVAECILGSKKSTAREHASREDDWRDSRFLEKIPAASKRSKVEVASSASGPVKRISFVIVIRAAKLCDVLSKTNASTQTERSLLWPQIPARIPNRHVPWLGEHCPGGGWGQPG